MRRDLPDRTTEAKRREVIITFYLDIENLYNKDNFGLSKKGYARALKVNKNIYGWLAVECGKKEIISGN